jgi:uncharacterized protein YggE
MKVVSTFLLFTLTFLTISAQSTEKFIRIVGNASMDRFANGAVSQISISEILPNEYQQIKYKSIDEVKNEFMQKLSIQNISGVQLKPSYKSNFGRYEKTLTENFELILSDIESITKLRNIVSEGVSISDLKFTYQNPGIETEEILAMKALEDARKKAEYIATKSGLKVGKILNIEDFSSGSCKEIDPRQERTHRLVYRMNITFELL